MGYPVLVLDLVLLVAIELTVVTTIPAVGTILAVALIVAPAATARLWTDRVGASMAIAAGVGAAGGAVGLVVSDHWSIAAGPTICVILSLAFAASAILSPRQGWLARRRPRPSSAPRWQRYGLAP
jgi:manganese/iron transport system permease protein